MISRNSQGAHLLVGALFLFALAGCAGQQALRDLDRSAEHLPGAAQLTDVPFHGQRDYQCGPASMAMVLQASGAEASVDELIPQIFLPERQGSVQPEMLATARRHGRIPYRIPGNLASLLSEIAAGHPVLVMQNLSLPVFPMWHYAVATGFDLDNHSIRLHTGETPDRDVGMRRFVNTWARSDHWAIVVLQPGTLPVSISARDAIQATRDFERFAGAGHAIPAWRAIVTRWPDAHLAWFALGNALYARESTDAAADAFTRSVTIDPGFGPGWINLGHVRLELGAREAAKEALHRAAAIEGPWQEAAIQALSDALNEK